MTAAATSSTTSGGRARRKLTSRRGRRPRASPTASVARAWISDAEPRISGASVLLSSSTAELMRSFISGWRCSSIRAAPVRVKLRASGRMSVRQAAAPAASTQAPVRA